MAHRNTPVASRGIWLKLHPFDLLWICCIQQADPEQIAPVEYVRIMCLCFSRLTAWLQPKNVWHSDGARASKFIGLHQFLEINKQDVTECCLLMLQVSLLADVELPTPHGVLIMPTVVK